jgi:uncharacterized membrane protein required for colicin V production
VDVLLVVFIGGFAVGGLRTGFLRSLLGLAFIVLAFVLGADLRHPVGVLASGYLKGVPASYADMLGYVIVFIVVLATAHLVARRLLANVAARGLPRVTDHALGAVFGGLEAILIISAAIVILDTYFGTKSALGQSIGVGVLNQLGASLGTSTTARLLGNTSVPMVMSTLGPLLPKDIARLLPGGLPTNLLSGLPVHIPFPGL